MFKILCTASLVLALLVVTMPAQSATPAAPPEEPSQHWACQPQTLNPQRCLEVSAAWAQQLEASRRVNARWSVACNRDQITAVSRCWAGTFGRPMASNGTPYTQGREIPFQVTFYTNGQATLGPFVEVGLHNFPGRRPMVRVDAHAPIELADDAGVSPRQPSPALVELLRRGQVVRARYHVWPKGHEDMFVELAGFEAAWQRLQQELQR